MCHTEKLNLKKKNNSTEKIPSMVESNRPNPSSHNTRTWTVPVNRTLGFGVVT